MSVPSRILVWIVRVYQVTLSPLLGAPCRFRPSCSNYAIEAVTRHGVARGSWLALKRVCRCAPWHPGGDDPVPEAGSARR